MSTSTGQRFAAQVFKGVPGGSFGTYYEPSNHFEDASVEVVGSNDVDPLRFTKKVGNNTHLRLE